MSAPKVGFVSLGCPKALVDSERILTQLKMDGYEVSPSYAGADVVVVNTCGFLDSAKQESLDAIGEALAENGRVIVTGCMGGDEQTILDVHPEVLAVSGPHQYEEVVSAVHQYVPNSVEHNPLTDLVPPQGIKLTPRHYAYLKISEGCNHACTFCIIPDIRGKLVSRPVGEVLDEAERLVKSGVKELLVISQDTSAYGVDIKYQTGFWQGRPVKTRMLDLCETLGELGIWVRLHYVYPYPHVDNVIPLMAEGKILPYLDIPFQHSSPTVLKAMKRPAHQEKTLDRIQAWRQTCPDLTLRSTFIAGFPGETDADFEHLLAWLKEAQLDRVGCFKYEAVEGARANALANAVPEELKQERWERLMETQQAISAARLQAKIGRTIEVIVDEVCYEPDEQGAVARSRGDAPEIDGNVFIDLSNDLLEKAANQQKPQCGDIIEVRINDADDYDLYGQLA
jgi:ribosomal protein S12 methylthiotransferase